MNKTTLTHTAPARDPSTGAVLPTESKSFAATQRVVMARMLDELRALVASQQNSIADQNQLEKMFVEMLEGYSSEISTMHAEMMRLRMRLAQQDRCTAVHGIELAHARRIELVAERSVADMRHKLERAEKQLLQEQLRAQKEKSQLALEQAQAKSLRTQLQEERARRERAERQAAEERIARQRAEGTLNQVLYEDRIHADRTLKNLAEGL